MNRPIIGGILLIVGTSIGGGMLALPLALISVGYFQSVILFVAAWLVTTICALYLLESNLFFPEGSNLITMTHKSLGRSGAILTWLFYMTLLYTLISAYTAGGSELLFSAAHSVSIPLSEPTSKIIFAVLVSIVLYLGVNIVDWINRGLMTIKIAAFLLLLSFFIPHTSWQLLTHPGTLHLDPSLLVVVTAFGYGSIIPTLRTYFKSHRTRLRTVVLAGSFIPLICYLFWIYAIDGALSQTQLQFIHAQHNQLAALNRALITVLDHNQWVSTLTTAFTIICILTSFLGVGLGLIDFLQDGLKLYKKKYGRLLSTLLAIIPPLAVVLFQPALFVKALAVAGLCCIALLICLPCLIICKKRPSTETHGLLFSRPIVFSMTLLALLLFLYALVVLI